MSIAPTKKVPTDISIILYGSMAQPRMTSFGPKCFFKLNGRTIIDYQLEAINEATRRQEVFVCGSFQIEKLINRSYKIIENQIDSNECEDIRLALNVISNNHVLLIDQAAYFKSLKFSYDTSFVVVGDGEEDISVNYTDYLESFSFNENKKWKGITYVCSSDLPVLKNLLDTRKYTNKFLFELINDFVSVGAKFKINESEGKIITTPKQLRE